MNEGKKEPLYARVATQLKQSVLQQQYAIGEFLPIEEDLQTMFSSSRTTIRKAVDILEKEGLVRREQGRGTRICSLNPKQDLNYLSSITETLTSMYGHVETGAISISRSKPSVELQHDMGISKDQDVYVLQRTKVVHGLVVAFLKNVVVEKHVPDLERHEAFLRQHGLYRTLEEIFGLVLDYAIENISVYMSGPLESALFEVRNSIPLFRSERKTFLLGGEVLEMDSSFIRAENFEYTVYLKGRVPTGNVPALKNGKYFGSK